MKPLHLSSFFIFASAALFVSITTARSEEAIYSVGIAKIDVTPDYPIRLNGYLARKSESDGIIQNIFAKALAIGSDQEGPAILITVDNCIIPAGFREKLLQRLAKKKITSENFAIAASHTHSAPKLAGAADNIFGMDLPPAEQAHIDRYSKELMDKMEQVALVALKDRKPAKLFWGKTSANFAANRRTKDGPVDHDLPVLKITDKSGKKIRALLVNYACHCTTLTDLPNQICGDWAGYAQEYLERDFPGAIAMTIIGCGADANPEPRPGVDFAKQHGQSITSAVGELLSTNLTPLHGKLETRAKQISLSFDKIPPREEFAKTAANTNLHFSNRYHAEKQLQRLDRGEKLPTELPYFVQTWNFGDELALVFLPGEVVVDYSLRLKKEFDPTRLWVNAYANEVPCYIPSKRIWNEGGYEGGGAMIYYDKPTRLAENTEGKIISAVHDLMPKTFLFDEKKAELERRKLEFPDPKSPDEALKSFRTKPGFTVNLVASEPQIVDPVAVDFSTDGKLWVLEMCDYPSGMDGNFKVPGGRVKLLEDQNGDGKFEKSTLFLDKLSFPTGLMQWRKGVLICAAPDIFYAEDTNGDGKADVVKKLFTGFATHNFQARVNSLRWGLNNWIYGSSGLFGGKIHSELTGKDIDCSGRDFRFNPDTGELETSGGVSQQGRVRDDFGNWFGCDNGTLLWNFPLPEKYARRNLNVALPEPSVVVAGDPDPNLLFPTSRTLERYNNPNSANRTTSACGVEIYRDDLLRKNFYGNSFVCEPVHNLVHRYRLERNGILFSAHRPDDEKQREFLASTDNWFRPVETRTGPDGALWVVDMYRFVIEHPKWIPAERLAKLDVRAGDDKGRIYRVYPKSAKQRPVQNLTKLKTAALVAALETSNGTERDLIHREIFQRADSAAIEPLKKIVATTKNNAVKIQALYALDGLKNLPAEMVVVALGDADEGVRENAIRLSEPFLKSGNEKVAEGLLKLASDKNIRVQFQLALSLGEVAASRESAAVNISSLKNQPRSHETQPRVGRILGELAKAHLGDSWLRAAVLSSASQYPGEILQSILMLEPETAGRNEMISALIATAAGSDNPKVFEAVLIANAPAENKTAASWQLTSLASVQEALQRKKLSLASFSKSENASVREAVIQIEITIESAAEIAKNESAALAERVAAIRLLSWSNRETNLHTLISLATGSENATLQKAAQDSLRLQQNKKLPALLMAGWPGYPVSMRASILEILLSREEGMQKVLDAVEQRIIKPAEVPMVNRQLLLKHADQKIRQRASVLFPQNADRAKILAKYSDAAKLTGDPLKGAVFFGKLCVNCHAFRGQGFSVGPDLMAWGDKSTQDFLLAILDPSSVIEPRYIQYNLELKDGRALSGIIKGETAGSVTLAQGGGTREKFLRSDILEMRASNLSLMPEGLEEGNSPQDFADLIAYLKVRPAQFGSATVEQAAASVKKFLPGGVTGFARLISSIETINYPSWLGEQPLAFCRQSDGKGKVEWLTKTAPEKITMNEFYSFQLPIGLGYLSAPSGKFTLCFQEKSILDFDVTLSDASWHSNDGRILMRYEVMENNAEDSNGILTISVQGDLLKAGEPLNFQVVGSSANSQRWFGIYLLPENQPKKGN
ncbi:MAG: neutral/alkaline non-lysosomal ceramidase N-terminal domain-containing protein [Verrucomicrobiota bacterium]